MADSRIAKAKKAMQLLAQQSNPVPTLFAEATKGLCPADVLTLAVLHFGTQGLPEYVGPRRLTVLMNSCPACAKPWSTQVRANSPMQDMMLGFLEQTPLRPDRVGIDIEVRRALKQHKADMDLQKEKDLAAQKTAQDREILQRMKCLELNAFGKELLVREPVRSETQLIKASAARLCDALTSVMGANAVGRVDEYAALVFDGTHRVLIGYRSEFEKIPVAVLMFKECSGVLYIELMGAWRNSGGSALVKKLVELARAEGFFAILAEAFYPDPEAMHLAPARQETIGFWLDAMLWRDLRSSDARCDFLNDVRAKQGKRKIGQKPSLERFFADLGYESPYEKGDFVPVGCIC